MKTAVVNNPVVIEDSTLASGVRQFGINLGPKMFSILSDGIYANKILAIIRELSTNAYDSHVKNGNPNQPFDVHLPTHTELEFSIRDYGVGLSNEELHAVYTTYGLSNKENSNDYTGCLGLGSKVPFCYNTKSFTIHNWHGGKHSCYKCFLDSNGYPSILKLLEEESVEPTGLKVIVPVKSSDISEFAKLAAKVYSVFQVLPNVNGTTLKNIEYVYRCNEFGIRTKSDICGMRVLMGNIAYPVNHTFSNQKINALKDLDIDLFVNIGDVDISTSRENLSYDAMTITYLENKINGIQSILFNNIQNNIDKCESIFQARRTLIDTLSKIRQSAKIVDPSAFHYKDVRLFCNQYYNIPLPANTNIKRIEISDDNKARMRTILPHEVYMQANQIFVLADLPIGNISRTRHYIRNCKNSVLLFDVKDDQELTKLVSIFGGRHVDEVFIKASSLDKPPVSVRRGRSSLTVSLFRNAYYASHSWIPTTLDIPTINSETVYVKTQNHKMVDTTVCYVHNTYNILKSLDLTVNIYGLNSHNCKKVVNLKHFVHLEDYIRKKLMLIRDYIIAGYIQSNFSVKYLDSILLMSHVNNHAKVIYDMKSALRFNSDNTNYYDTYLKYKLDRLLPIAFSTIAKDHPLQQAIEKLRIEVDSFISHYPAVKYLEYISANHRNEFIKEVIGEKK